LRLAGAGPVVRLNGPDLGLAGSDLGLTRTDFGLTRSHFRLARAGFRLAGAGWLYLRPVVWLAWAITLAWPGFGLAGAVVGHVSRICSRVGAGEARLRGDRPGGRNDGWLASIDVVELLAVLLRFALMLDLS
jgi:hypothetical protein